MATDQGRDAMFVLISFEEPELSVVIIGYQLLGTVSALRLEFYTAIACMYVCTCVSV